MNTKSKAYASILHSLADSQARVFEHLATSPKPLSRIEIAEDLDMRVSSVCGRVNELLKKGHIRVTGIGTDPVTNKKVELLGVIEVQGCI